MRHLTSDGRLTVLVAVAMVGATVVVGCGGRVLPGAQVDGGAAPAALPSEGEVETQVVPSPDAGLEEGSAPLDPTHEPGEVEAGSAGAPADAVEPLPAQPTGDGADSGDATGGAFPAGTYLFIEIVEERQTKSATGGQTTSFAQEQESYRFDPNAGTLSGALDGEMVAQNPTIVGRLVLSRVDANSAAAGQLFVLAGSGQEFGDVVIQSVSSDGVAMIVVRGEYVSLGPGDSVSVEQASRATDDRLAMGSSRRTVTVTNHGFMPLDGLGAAAP